MIFDTFYHNFLLHNLLI